MGRTYIFDCEKCGYRARVAGGIAEALELTAQTILCVECHSLHDSVIALKVPVSGSDYLGAPPLEDVINPLQVNDRGPMRWEYFELACPVSPDHKVQEWRHPGKCPLCGFFMEPSALPFREWK